MLDGALVFGAVTLDWAGVVLRSDGTTAGRWVVATVCAGCAQAPAAFTLL